MRKGSVKTYYAGVVAIVLGDECSVELEGKATSGPDSLTIRRNNSYTVKLMETFTWIGDVIGVLKAVCVDRVQYR